MNEINLTYFKSKGKIYIPFDEHNEILKSYKEEIEKLHSIIKEQDKELELERKSRQLLTDDLANVCKISLKKDNIIKEIREYIDSITWSTNISNLQDIIWHILDKGNK